MTHPYGKYWEQPDTKDIVLDDKYALMANDTLEKLKNYSRSQPSGVYAGKMWRCTDDGVTWYLKWWTDIEGTTMCKNHTREIVIL